MGMMADEWPSLRRTLLRLRFIDSPTEERYRRYQGSQTMRLLLVGLLTSLVVWGSAHILVAILFPDAFGVISWALFGFMYPLLVVAHLVSRSASLRRFTLHVVMATNIGAALVTVFVLQLWMHQTMLAMAGVIAVIFFGLILYRLGLSQGTVLGAVDSAFYLAAIAFQIGRGEIPVGEGLLSSFCVLLTFFLCVAFAYVMEVASRDAFAQQEIIAAQQKQIEAERAKAESLLRNILPESIAAELKGGREALAQDHANVTVLFADIVGFTSLSETMTPAALVELLDDVFTRFDELSERLGVEKIKTIGDAYMVASGLPEAREDHAQAAVRMGLGMLENLREMNEKHGRSLTLRIGIWSGHVVAGVIGKKKFAYDLWGDVVNTAARMESHGVPGAIQIGEPTRRLLGDEWNCEERGVIEIKGTGAMPVWLIRRDGQAFQGDLTSEGPRSTR
jgi:adenylate cyclase